MRRIGIALIVLVMVVAAGVVIFVATFNVNKYRATIQSQLQQRLGRSVTLGAMRLSVFPPRFRVQDLAVADDSRFNPDAPFVKTKELDVSVRFLPLLHKDVQISSLLLQRPSVNLIKNHAGVWNFASLGRSPEAGSAGQATGSAQTKTETSQGTPSGKPSAAESAPGTQPERSGKAQFSLDELTVQDGQISLLDQQSSSSPTQYDHIDLTLKNFAPNQPFAVDVAAHIAGAGSQDIRLRGKGGPVVQSAPTTTPFHGTLDLKEVGLADLSKFLNSPALNGTNGTLTGQTKITSDSGKLTAEGETSIQNTKVRGMELGYPISVQYDLTDDLVVDTVSIRKLILKLGSMPLEMSGTIDGHATPAQIDLKLAANNVSIAEAAKLAAASGAALSQGTTVSGTLNANLQARGAADKPALAGTVSTKNVQASGKDIAQPIQIQTLNLNLSPDEVRSDPFNVVSGGTTMEAQFSVHNYTSASPTVNASMRAPNAQLPAVLAMAKAYGVTSLDKVSGSGTLNVDMHGSGPVKSLNQTEIMRVLNGSVALDLNNIKYSGANITRELSKIAGFLNANVTPQVSQEGTNIQKVTGHIDVKNGIAQTNDLQAQLEVGNVGLAGTASLIDEALNLHATAVLSQPVSQKAGGQNVGGFMKTALANGQGELVIPALITGTFSKPRFEPDVQQLAQMKLKRLLPDINNPASVAGTIQNLLGGPKNPAEGQQAQQQNQQQQNPVQQFLGMFGKKKQENAQPPK